MVRSQFAHKVVNACLRAPLHNLDDANIDRPRPILFVHIASHHEPPPVPRVSNGSHEWWQPLTVKFLLGVVSKICALHGRPLFRITAGMYLPRARRCICLERELRAFAPEL